jgi:hypothetical protein
LGSPLLDRKKSVVRLLRHSFSVAHSTLQYKLHVEQWQIE